MSLVVAGNTCSITEAHKQDRLCPLERLDLAFFIHTEDHGVIGRIQVKSYDVAHLLNKIGICRKLKAARTMRL